MYIKHLTEQNFQQEVLNAGQPVLVDFYADWCGPCKMLTPVLTELASEVAGKATVGKVNIDENSALASEYDISSIPTLLLFRDGKLTKKMVGLRSKKDLKAIFE